MHNKENKSYVISGMGISHISFLLTKFPEEHHAAIKIR